jgi:5-methylcytosine-specific restriction endonuclease McrA
MALKKSPLRRKRSKRVNTFQAARRKASTGAILENNELKMLLDSAWSRLVRDRVEGLCEWCGKPGCEAHHMVSRSKSLFLRHRLENGVYLCKGCHLRFHNTESHTGWELFVKQRHDDAMFVIDLKWKTIPVKRADLLERFEEWGCAG